MSSPDPPVRRGSRIAFANQLRGIAALLVACSHLIGVYCNVDFRPVIAAATFSPVKTFPIPAIYWLIAYKWLEIGPLGVGLFFLISGMVIPISLARHSRVTFLLARVLRIYPIFMIALLCEMLLLYGASRYWGKSFDISVRSIVTNLFLVNDLTGNPVIDFVNWTLAIEVKFYLAILVLAGTIRLGRVRSLFVAAIAFVIIVHLALLAGRAHPPGWSVPVLRTIGLELPFIVFMFIGVLFTFHNRGQLGTRGLLIALPAMTMLFVAAWRLGVLRPEYPIVTVNYLYAIGIFGGLYALRHRIGENRILDFIASISYPFYLIHAVIGFSVMKYLMVRWDLNFNAAFACALIAIAALATLLHRTIELKTIAWGHRVSPKPRLEQSEIRLDQKFSVEKPICSSGPEG